VSAARFCGGIHPTVSFQVVGIQLRQLLQDRLKLRERKARIVTVRTKPRLPIASAAVVAPSSLGPSDITTMSYSPMVKYVSVTCRPWLP